VFIVERKFYDANIKTQFASILAFALYVKRVSGSVPLRPFSMIKSTKRYGFLSWMISPKSDAAPER